MMNTSPATPDRRPARRRGSALLVTLMVTVILSMLGLAFLTMSDTENKISVNERDAKQCVYMAQLAAKLAAEWFQQPRPNGTGAFANATAQIPTRAEMSFYPIPYGGASPSYKNGACAGCDVAGNYLFDRPYRGAPKDTLRGTEVRDPADTATYPGPDIYVTDETFDSSGSTYLNRLNVALGAPSFSGDPDDPIEGINSNSEGWGNTRITDIRVYGPPTFNGYRYGVATIRATATKFFGEEAISSRSVYITLNEIKFPAPTGPLTAKGVVNFQGNVFVHWGEVISYHEIDLNCLNCANGPPLGLPWEDRFTTADFGDLSAGSLWSSNLKWAALQGISMFTGNQKYADLWFRLRGADDITQFPYTTCVDQSPGDIDHDQDAPRSTWLYNCESPVDQRTVTPWGSTDFNANGYLEVSDLQTAALDADAPANIFRWDSSVVIPEIEYDVWKRTARGRAKNLHYMTRQPDTSLGPDCAAAENCWQEDSIGTADTLLHWTNIADGSGGIVDSKPGIWFFDTDSRVNPQPPTCLLSDLTCRAAHLTPAFGENGNEDMFVGGFVYMNTLAYDVKGVNGQDIFVPWPGELKDFAWKDVNTHIYTRMDWNGDGDLSDTFTGGGITFDEALQDYFWIYAPCRDDIADLAANGPCPPRLSPLDPAFNANTPDPHLRKLGDPVGGDDSNAGHTTTVLAVDTDLITEMDQTWTANTLWAFYDLSELEIKYVGDVADYDPTEDPSKPFVNFSYEDADSNGDGTAGPWGAGVCCTQPNNTDTEVRISAGGATGDPILAGMHWGVDMNGPSAPMQMDVYGIVFNEGNWGAEDCSDAGAAGNTVVFGSMLFNGCFRQNGTADVFFDERIIKNQWPPDEWKIPRVKAGSWKSE